MSLPLWPIRQRWFHTFSPCAELLGDGHEGMWARFGSQGSIALNWHSRYSGTRYSGTWLYYALTMENNSSGYDKSLWKCLRSWPLGRGIEWRVIIGHSEYGMRSVMLFNSLRPGLWFTIKILSFQYRKSHCRDKTILRPSYLHNGIPCTGKMTSLYWIGALVMDICVSELDHHWFRKWLDTFPAPSS